MKQVYIYFRDFIYKVSYKVLKVFIFIIYLYLYPIIKIRSFLFEKIKKVPFYNDVYNGTLFVKSIFIGLYSLIFSIFVYNFYTIFYYYIFNVSTYKHYENYLDFTIFWTVRVIFIFFIMMFFVVVPDHCDNYFKNQHLKYNVYYAISADSTKSKKFLNPNFYKLNYVIGLSTILIVLYELNNFYNYLHITRLHIFSYMIINSISVIFCIYFQLKQLYIIVLIENKRIFKLLYRIFLIDSKHGYTKNIIIQKIKQNLKYLFWAQDRLLIMFFLWCFFCCIDLFQKFNLLNV